MAGIVIFQERDAPARVANARREVSRVLWEDGPIVGAVEKKRRNVLAADEGDRAGLVRIGQTREDRFRRSVGEGIEGIGTGNADKAAK